MQQLEKKRSDGKIHVEKKGNSQIPLNSTQKETRYFSKLLYTKLYTEKNIDKSN